MKSVFLFLGFSAWLVFAGPNDGYEIRFERAPSKAGDKYHVKHTMKMSNSTLLTIEGDEVRSERLSLEYNFRGKTEILGIDDDGGITSERIQVAELVVVRDGKKTQVLPPGAMVTAQHPGTGSIFSLANGELSPEAQEPLSMLFGEMESNDEVPDYDAIYGSTTPRKIGETWTAPPEMLLKLIPESRHLAFDEQSLSGQTTLVGLVKVGAYDCLSVRMGYEAKKVTLKNMPPDAKLVSFKHSSQSYMKLPLDISLPQLESGSKLTMSHELTIPTPDGPGKMTIANEVITQSWALPIK